MDRTHIKTQLGQYITKVKNSFDPEQIILYGSFAQKKATEWSDIDVLVVANFKTKSIQKRLDALWNISKDITANHIFDVRGLTPEEFTQASHLTIYGEIKKEGIVIYQKNK